MVSSSGVGVTCRASKLRMQPKLETEEGGRVTVPSRTLPEEQPEHLTAC